MDEKTVNSVMALIMAMYVDEPCRICGKNINPEDLSELVYAGYSADNKLRSAHGKCWKQGRPKEEWAFPEP